MAQMNNAPTVDAVRGVGRSCGPTKVELITLPRHEGRVLAKALIAAIESGDVDLEAANSLLRLLGILLPDREAA